MSLKRIRFILYLSILFSNASYSFGQTLSLDDIFKIYALDSIALKQFCAEKNFELVFIDEDDWAFEYSFQSKSDEKIFVYRTFPKDGSAGPFVRYYFNNQHEYENFEKLIKARDFDRIKYKSYSKKISTEISTKHFVDPKSEWEIGMEKYNAGASKYALTLGAFYQ